MSSCCPIFLRAFNVVSVLDFGHFDRCKVVSCGFNLYFPDDMWSIFYMLVCDLNIFFGEVPVKVFGTFFKLFVF